MTSVGADGVPAWMRVQGRRFYTKDSGVRRICGVKAAQKGAEQRPEGNAGARWREGVIWGKARCGGGEARLHPESPTRIPNHGARRC